MRQYECECLKCGRKGSFAFHEPFPQFGDTFSRYCTVCNETTIHTRTLTKKIAAELRAVERENTLRQSIIDKCAGYGFKCRFVYQSVVITTHLCDWCFDYHQSKITLFHESTVKINFSTGDYSKSHVQFRERKMKPLDVIEYIAAHDTWRAAHPI